MAQFSVYFRVLDSKEAADSMERRIERKIPARGSVYILTLTDKQYENIHIYEGNERGTPEKPDQLALF